VAKTKRRNNRRQPKAQSVDLKAAIAELRRQIDQLCREHPAKLASRGRQYVKRIEGFEWYEEDRELNCEVQGSAYLPYQVCIHVPPDDDPGLGLDAVCTCPYSTGIDLCKHTWAALQALDQELSDASSEVVAWLFGGQVKAGWESVLADLDGFLAQVGAPQDPVGPDRTRLTWRVLFTGVELDGLVVTAYEQKLNKAGTGWTKGRKVTWDRLSRYYDRPLDPRDVQVVQSAKRNDGASSFYSYYSYYYDADRFQALRALVGHPLVFSEENPDRQLTIAEGKMGLAVQSVDDGWQLLPTVDERPLGEDARIISHAGQGIVLIDNSKSLLTVVPLEDERVERFFQGVHLQRPVFPDQARSDLMTRLGALQEHLPVDLPEQLSGPLVEAAPHWLAQLQPQTPQGLDVALRVQPTGEGADFLPGEGPPRLAGTRNEQPVMVGRDPQAEMQQAETLAEQLGLRQRVPLGDFQWRIPNDDDALDMIARLQDRSGDDLSVVWPEGQRVRVSGEVAPSALRVQIDEGTDWFGISGTIDVDGQQIKLAELLAALRSGGRFVPIGPGLYARISQALRERLAALADVAQPTRHGLELDVTAAPVVEQALGGEVSLQACAAWRDVIRRLDEAEDLCPDPPATFTAELRDYQLEGYRWLRRLAAWGVGGCLADDMGLGKTIQALALLIDRTDQGPALVVAPTSVGFNWVRETQRFAPTLRPVLYRESDRQELLASAAAGDVVIVSYGLLQRDAARFAETEWGTLVLDEAQFVKNTQTKRAQAVRAVQAGWRLALTGTPLENHLGELWSLFRAISPGMLGSWERFKERFAGPIEKRRDADRRHALSRLVRPFILRRTKSEVLDELPERTEMLRHAELPPSERKRYDQARLTALARLADVGNDDGRDRRFEVLAALTQLRQLACHPALVDKSYKRSSAKLDLFLEIVEELREGNHRALVFSQFTQHLALIRKALDKAGVSYLYLDGKTTPKQRTERIDAFQRGEGELFLISLKAGGTGLNLTAADYVIHMDPWWNPAVEDQATDRAHRIGQTRPVTVYRLVTKDSIEEQILALHEKKRDLVSGVLEGTDRAGKLSTAELVALIRGEDPQEASAAVVEVPSAGRRGSKPRRQAASGTKPARKTKKSRVASAARQRRN